MQWSEIWPMLLEGTADTLGMVLISTALGYLIGLPLGVVLNVTDKDGIHPMYLVNRILGFIVN